MYQVALSQYIMGVFGLVFGFGFCPVKVKSQTKELNLESIFFKTDFLVV
jgi:hypothetical protein